MFSQFQDNNSSNYLRNSFLFHQSMLLFINNALSSLIIKKTQCALFLFIHDVDRFTVTLSVMALNLITFH